MAIETKLSARPYSHSQVPESSVRAKCQSQEQESSVKAKSKSQVLKSNAKAIADAKANAYDTVKADVH